jgi:hypothetical protein
MEQLWQIISGAPWWVYVLFVILVIIGIKATKPSTVAIQRLIVLPIVFIAWSLYNLYQNVSLGFPSLIVWWVLSLGFGIYLGYNAVNSWKIHSDRRKKTVTIPGNYSTLILVISIFVLSFFWGYFYATLESVPFWIYLADTISLTLIKGVFVGRGACFLKNYLYPR